MLSIFLIIHSLNFLSLEKAHEFHLSKGLIEYVESEQSLQITMYVFIDDFEEALKQKNIDKLFICTSKESENADQHIYDYFQETFILEIDQKQASFDYIGKEIAEDMIGMWCYLEVTQVTPFEKITIKNSLMTEVFDDQKNIINLIGPKKKQSYFMMDLKNQTEEVNF